MNKKPASHSHLSNFIKVILPAVISVALFTAVIFLVLLPAFKNNMLLRKKETCRELVLSVCSLLDSYKKKEDLGELTREEVQKQAKRAA